MEHSFVVALFIIFLALTTLNNGAEQDYKLFVDSDEIDLNFYSSEDSFATISDDVKDLIASPESVLGYDQSSVNPANLVEFKKGRRRGISQNIWAGGVNFGNQNIELHGYGNGGNGGYGETKCPFGFTRFQDVCYYLSKERALIEEALMYCRKMDTELVSIVTKTDWINVKAFIESQQPEKYNTNACEHDEGYIPGNIFRVWTSANDGKREGNFIWEGRNVEMSYTDWCPGEPNNYLNEDCMEIWFNTAKPHRSCWNDLFCNKSCKVHYLCEKRLFN